LHPLVERMSNHFTSSPASDNHRPRWVTPALVCALLATLAGCKDSPTSPTTSTTTTTTTTVASPTVTEDFTGVLPVGGNRFYSFTVVENGTVNVTLNSIGGAGVPSTVFVALGVGTPSAEECTTTSTVTIQAGSTAQISSTYAPGIYCAKVVDIGNLFAPASFSISIAHP